MLEHLRDRGYTLDEAIRAAIYFYQKNELPSWINWWSFGLGGDESNA